MHSNEHTKYIVLLLPHTPFILQKMCMQLSSLVSSCVCFTQVQQSCALTQKQNRNLKRPGQHTYLVLPNTGCNFHVSFRKTSSCIIAEILHFTGLKVAEFQDNILVSCFKDNMDKLRGSLSWNCVFHSLKTKSIQMHSLPVDNACVYP